MRTAVSAPDVARYPANAWAIRRQVAAEATTRRREINRRVRAVRANQQVFKSTLMDCRSALSRCRESRNGNTLRCVPAQMELSITCKPDKQPAAEAVVLAAAAS